MNIEILSPEGQLFGGEAKSVKLPGENGQFQVLKDHAALISNLVKGEVIVETQEGNKNFSVESGVVEVLRNKIIVLV